MLSLAGLRFKLLFLSMAGLRLQLIVAIVLRFRLHVQSLAGLMLQLIVTIGLRFGGSMAKEIANKRIVTGLRFRLWVLSMV